MSTWNHSQEDLRPSRHFIIMERLSQAPEITETSEAVTAYSEEQILVLSEEELREVAGGRSARKGLVIAE